MNHHFFRHATFLGFTVCILFTAQSVSAASVVWGTDLGASLYRVQNGSSYAGGERCVAVLGGAHVDIQYGADAFDAVTGVPVCGTSIAKGTKVSFKFRPRSSQDIYWFGTGFSWDSPYGDWSAGSAPPTNAATFCSAKNYYSSTGGSDFFGNLALDTAATRTISNLGGFTCEAASNGYDLVCTATSEGSFAPTFNFGAASGKFYATYVNSGTSCEPLNPEALRPLQSVASEYWPMDGTGWRGCTGAAPYSLSVPQQSIQCSITVTAASTQTPASPTITSAAGTSCTVGTPFSISFSATDPSGKDVRYGVDWNNDGSIDQIVPAAGYVPSGTLQTASRAFTTAGAKTVRVIAINSSGVSSRFASHTFTCAGSSTTSEPFGDDWDDSDWGYAGQAGAASASPDLTLRATPSLVHPSDTVKVSWSATRVASCTVAGTNGDVWDTITSAPGGNASAAIHQSTTYTLRCLDLHGTSLEKSVTVNILPNWQEQ